jgi:DNA-binding NarL/FixJ family response regulator
MGCGADPALARAVLTLITAAGLFNSTASVTRSRVNLTGDVSPPFQGRIVMPSEHEDSGMIFDALRAGAAGYLLKKHTSSKQLEAAIEEVLAGGAPLSPSVARKVIAYFQTTDPVLSLRAAAGFQPTQPLSMRQQQVLDLLTEGLMYKEIAARLGISINGIRKHLQVIYHKLHVRSRCDPALRNWTGRVS